MANVGSAELLFQQLDRDGNGSLSYCELSSRLADAGLDDEEIERLVYKLDADGDGEVSLAEFRYGYNGMPELVARFGVSEAEMSFAKNGGHLDLQVYFCNGEKASRDPP